MKSNKKATPNPQYDDPYDTFRTPRTIPFLWDVSGWMNDKDDWGANNGTAYDLKNRSMHGKVSDTENAS